MDHINKDTVIHSLSFGFSMTEKEHPGGGGGGRRRGGETGTEGTTQEVTLNTYF